MDTSFQIWIFTGAIGVGGTLICWLMNRAINRLDSDMREHSERLDNHDDMHTSGRISLSEFRVEVARDYSRDVNVQQSLARIHDRMDKLPKEIVDLLNRFMK